MKNVGLCVLFGLMVGVAGCGDDSEGTTGTTDGGPDAAADTGGGGPDSSVGFGTGLPCFMFPDGQIAEPADWPHEIPDAHVLGNASIIMTRYNLGGATDQAEAVLNEYRDTVFAGFSPTTTVDDMNNRIITFTNGSNISGEIEAFSADGGFEAGTCVRVNVEYNETPI